MRVLVCTISLSLFSLSAFVEIAYSKSQSIKIALFDLNLVQPNHSLSIKSTKKKGTAQAVKSTVLTTEEMLAFANQTMRQGLRVELSNQTRFKFIETPIRQQLLDPAWSQSPSSIEEALELGRELGVDWVIQGRFKEIGPDTFRVTLYLLALTPNLWTPAELIPKDHATQLIDFNTLSAPSLILAEHIVWASRKDGVEVQLAKAGLRLLLKADQEQGSRKDKLQIPKKVTEEEEEEEEAKEEEEPAELSARQKKAKELSDAARQELDDIQARLDAEHKRREEEAKLKQQALAEEASEAWRILEEISDGAGLNTVLVEEPPKPILSKRQRRRKIKKRRKRRKKRDIIKPAFVTWQQIKKATQSVNRTSKEEHRQLLLNFIRTYEKGLPSYHAQVAEARNRFTWLNREQIEWIPIRSGRFQVGSSFPVKDERPIQWIDISAFEASISEVTNAQYKRCVDAGVCSKPHWDDKTCEVFTDLNLKRERLPAQMRRGDMPVVCIDWNQANTFARWVGGRLLSETEWEFIARSNEKSFVYPWGLQNADCSLAVMYSGHKSGCGFGIPWPVCSKLQGRSHIGLCDLAGNVWEWVADQYRPDHEKVPSNGKPFLGGGRKVLKGGSFSSNYKELYASTRGQLGPRERANSVGFRVARPEQDAR